MIESLIVLTVLILILCFAYQYDKKHKTNNNNKSNESSDYLHTNLLNVYGLGLPLNTMCEIVSYNDYYEFIALNNSFKLDKNNVTDVSIKAETDIQDQYVSSAGGAIAGATLFGPLGAIIGGRAKKKQIKHTTIYLIFTYIKDNSVQYITFNATGKLYCNKFVREFKKSNTNNLSKIEL